MKKYFDHRQISRLAGISEAQVRYWERTGLIPCRERDKGQLLFDFQSLVAFRTLKSLLEKGLSTRRIRQFIARLQKSMPEIGQPLTELRISLHGDRLIVCRDNMKLTPEGQILMDLEGNGRQIPSPVSIASVEDLFFQAMECEEKNLFQEARSRYEAVLAVKPDHADSLVSLGNIQQRLGFPQEAECCYRKALRADADHVEANFNMGNVFADREEYDNATLFYFKTIHEDPEFDSAYYNLGIVLEKAGEPEEAKKYWKIYLTFDSESPYARFVRNRLKDIDSP